MRLHISFNSGSQGTLNSLLALDGCMLYYCLLLSLQFHLFVKKFTDICLLLYAIEVFTHIYSCGKAILIGQCYVNPFPVFFFLAYVSSSVTILMLTDDLDFDPMAKPKHRFRGLCYLQPMRHSFSNPFQYTFFYPLCFSLLLSFSLVFIVRAVLNGK